MVICSVNGVAKNRFRYPWALQLAHAVFWLEGHHIHCAPRDDGSNGGGVANGFGVVVHRFRDPQRRASGQ